jgi:hypothetical protein
MNISAIDRGQKGAGSPGQPPGRWRSRGPALRLGLLTGAAGLTILATACTAGAPRHASAAAPRSHRGTVPVATSSQPAPTASPAPGAPSAFGYLPLYPFASRADALAWQASSLSGGHQPWHLSAGQTALSFTQGYLGFAGINLITGQTVRQGDARVAVGFAITAGRTSTAAVIHLVRFGTGRLAPWEVVGTDDTDFSLTSPAYGSAASSPLMVGGRISGIEDSIRIQVRELSSGVPLADSCCHGAVSGIRQAWHATVQTGGGTDPAFTVVASHDSGVAAVAQFAVTGLRSLDLASSYSGPHFTTPQAAMRYPADAYNRGDTTAMRAVTDPAARTALTAMRSEAVNLELTSCAATHHGDYLCSFRHDYPASMHGAGHGAALFIAAPALNPGWYMFRFLDCC